MTDYSLENAARERGALYVCGTDEAGRGPLAGAVFAAAVILPPGLEYLGLDDSKKLSEKRRSDLSEEIKRLAVAWAVESVSAAEIDRINILNAAMLAMRKAVAGLDPAPDHVLVDGNRYPGTGLREEPVVKGDARSVSIAAASILAKVARDEYMKELDAAYPQYCFAKHKGYPTALHYEKLREFGPCPEHRLTFLKKMH